MENQISTNQERVPLSWINPVHSSTSGVEASTESVEQDLESRPEHGIRDATGKFVAGNPGNPGSGGRPPTKRISDAYRRILETEGADKYAAVVAQDALEAKNARDRLAAIQEMSDRVEGKAVQSIRHAGVFMVMAPGAEALQALDSWAEDE